MKKIILAGLSIAAFLSFTSCDTTTTTIIGSIDDYTGTGAVTQGAATTVTSNLLSCGNGRVSGVGTISSADGTVWTVPADNVYTTGTFAPDLHNECTGVQYANTAAIDFNNVPVVEVDANGTEIITAYLFGDNYFELYINGTLIGIDPVPFTPFNSNVVRFQVNKPYTIALKLVDWEENLGLGTEDNQGSAYHPGDGGFVGIFKDANNAVVAKTGSDWKAQTYYTAPVYDLTCLTESGTTRSSSSCTTSGTDDGSQAFGVHWAVPSDWKMASFDDTVWPNATTYTNTEIGVDNKSAYTNFVDIFDDSSNDAQFIWSTNVVLDNLVLARYTVQ
jgi:hypothetical protein